jgi:hypothetical protein
MPSLPTDRRIEIHQGDIVVEDGDIFGDGVNIAACLGSLAEPGDICVSARVREDAAGKLDLAFRDLGGQQLKKHRAALFAPTLSAMQHRRLIACVGSSQEGLLPLQSSWPLPRSEPRHGGLGLDRAHRLHRPS